MDILERIEEHIENMDYKALLREFGWDNLPPGWTEKSVKKFAQSLVGDTSSNAHIFSKCMDKIKGAKGIKTPERFCAALKDHILKTTKWRHGRNKKN